MTAWWFPPPLPSPPHLSSSSPCLLLHSHRAVRAAWGDGWRGLPSPPSSSSSSSLEDQLAESSSSSGWKGGQCVQLNWCNYCSTQGIHIPVYMYDCSVRWYSYWSWHTMQCTIYYTHNSNKPLASINSTLNDYASLKSLCISLNCQSLVYSTWQTLSGYADLQYNIMLLDKSTSCMPLAVLRGLS